MEALRTLADQLDEVAATLAELRPEEADPGAAVWGGDGPGALGGLTAALRGQLTAALYARSREAVTAGARISGLAGDVRTAADGYAEADEAARRHAGELS